MKTCIFTTSYLDGNDLSGSSRLERNLKYLYFYRNLKEELGFTQFHFCDNASSMESLEALGGYVVSQKGEVLMSGRPDLIVTRYDEHLKRGGSGTSLDYPYCWRGMYHMRDVANHGYYDKIILIDSDAFVLSERLAKYLKKLNSGWTSLWCPMYGFPENSISVLCRDAFPLINNFCTGDFMTHNGKMMETVTPFTHIEKKFVGDRYGEIPVPQMDGMDYYCQSPAGMPMKFIRTKDSERH